MTRRTVLRVWVKLGMLACAIAFAGIFVYGMFSPGLLSSGEVIDIGGLPAGTARLDAWNGKPVWVVHRSARQLDLLQGLSDYVTAPDRGGHPGVNNLHRSLDGRYGIYLAATDRSGILVQYVRDRPDGLDATVPWHGGFIDPGSDAMFDAAGRRYRGTRGGPLEVPPHRFTDAGNIMLGEW